MEPAFTIGQLAKRVGVNVETLRYYERLDLLAPSTRKSSGYRVYGPSELQRLHFIKNAQALGFTLHEIAEFLNLRVGSTAVCGDVRRKTRVKLRQVEKKIVDLQSLASSLRKLIRSCNAEQITDQCPILESLEHQAGRISKEAGGRGEGEGSDTGNHCPEGEVSDGEDHDEATR